MRPSGLVLFLFGPIVYFIASHEHPDFIFPSPLLFILGAISLLGALILIKPSKNKDLVGETVLNSLKNENNYLKAEITRLEGLITELRQKNKQVTGSPDNLKGKVARGGSNSETKFDQTKKSLSKLHHSEVAQTNTINKTMRQRGNMTKGKRIALAALAWLSCHMSIYIGAGLLGINHIPAGPVSLADAVVAISVFVLTAPNKESEN